MLTRKSIDRGIISFKEVRKRAESMLRSVVVPCTVAFAPAAVSRPIDPTMKYWKTRLVTCELPDR